MATLNTLVSPSGVATLTGTETLTNKTLTSPTIQGATLSGTTNVTGTLVASNVSGTVAIANGGTGATTATAAMTALNRASYLREQNGATFVPGSIYSIYSGATAITMYLPTFANTIVGDTIRCVELFNGGWAIANWTVAIPANTYLNMLAENMTIDTSVGAFSITCTFKDATNAYWTLSLG